MAFPIRRTARLPFGRLSEPGATYFVTFCTKGRAQALTRPEAATALTEVLATMVAQQDIDLIAATIMPDHVHLLFALRERLAVGQVMGEIKALSRRRIQVDWQWQAESFEHRVRLNDTIEDYGFYIFMNPYRAGLCALARRWPWWFCPDSSRLSFLSLLECDSIVPEEWSPRSQDIGDTLGICRQNGPPTSGGPTQDSRG